MCNLITKMIATKTPLLARTLLNPSIIHPDVSSLYTLREPKENGKACRFN